MQYVHPASDGYRLSGPPRRHRVQRVLFVLAFVVLVAGTAAGTAAARHEAHENAEHRIAVAAHQGVASLERTIDDLVRALGGSAAIVGEDGDLRVEVFGAFVDDAMALDELEVAALVGVVGHSDRTAFEERIGGPIRSLTDGKLKVAPARSTYFPVLAVRSVLAGGPVVGTDVTSDAALAEAVRRALTSESIAVSGPTALSVKGVEGIALVRPLLHQEGTEQHVRGLVVAKEPMQWLTERISGVVGDSIRFAVLRDDEVVAGDGEVVEDPAAVRPARVVDETWRVAVRPTHGPDLALAWLVGAGGAAATAAMAALLFVTQRHERALAAHGSRLEATERRRRAERDLAGELAQALTADQVTATLIDHLPTAVGAERAAISLQDEAGSLVVLDRGGTPDRVLPTDQGSWIARTLATSESAWLHSPQDWRHDPSTASVAGDARGLALIPFRADEVRGVLIVSYGRYHILSDEERAVLQTVALLAGRALARGRRYDTDHDAAIEFQRAALPAETPAHDSLAIAARYRPGARRAAVGGDWYDTVVLPDQRVLLVVGDVVGHGMAAAATMGRLRTAFHVLAPSHPDPGALLEAMSEQVESIPDAFCTTVVCVLVDPAHNTMRWARAGHLPPLLVGDDGAELLEAPGMPPLGVVDGVRAPVHQRILRAGDLLVLYTDGLVERRGESIDDGLERLRIVAGDLADLCPAEFCDTLVEALVPEEHQRDDIAVLAVRPPAYADPEPEPVRGAEHSSRYGDREPGATMRLDEASRRLGEAHVPTRAEQFTQAVDGSVGAPQIGPTRERFEDWLRGIGIDGDTKAELAIVFSELVANAVTASPPGSTVHFRARCTDGDLILEVENGSPHSVAGHAATWDLDDPLRPGGRGLLIVNAYMDSVQVEPPDDANGILVRCRRTLVPA